MIAHEALLDKIWHRPTLPHFTAVPPDSYRGALAGLTSLFGPDSYRMCVNGIVVKLL